MAGVATNQERQTLIPTRNTMTTKVMITVRTGTMITKAMTTATADTTIMVPSDLVLVGVVLTGVQGLEQRCAGPEVLVDELGRHPGVDAHEVDRETTDAISFDDRFRDVEELGAAVFDF